MNSFKTPLIVETMGNRFKLFHSFTYHWKRYNIDIQVPKGFVTDFASIPRLLRIFIPKLGLYNKAAVLHDYAYQKHLKVKDFWWFFTRRDADLLLLDAMTDLGVKKWKRNIMYRAVRIFGFLSWR